jgi:hypothetical protein
MSETRMRFTIHGKEVVVRKCAERIVNGVLAVKDAVGAAIVSCPPAALAWAGVAILLPVGPLNCIRGSF